MEKDEEIKQVTAMRKRVENTPDLVISRVPKKELKWFKEFANEEFEGDYGMALKMLCVGMIPPENMEIAKILQDHEQRILKLEEVQGKEDSNEIKLGNGKVIKR